jgi:undecaprenyl phosphate N,N'-diacetylbacillosamine 1-phosphate transferase
MSSQSVSLYFYRNFFSLYRNYIKPAIDFIAALVILVIASPFLLISILLLYVANHGKVWFLQQRPGKNEKTFRVIKFKTMTDARNDKGELLADAQRLTLIGKFIRKTSIDELPQLFNVLKGDMSIVGPRPLLMEYLPLYNERQHRRHEVKPGITGWAQVNGRNNLPWKKRLEFDVWYVEHQSFLLDLRIVLTTAVKVLRSADINQEGQATVQNFKGNEYEE